MRAEEPQRRCCRLADVRAVAEAVFGAASSWERLAQRALRQGSDSPVLARFLEQWETILLPGTSGREQDRQDRQDRLQACDSCAAVAAADDEGAGPEGGAC